MKCEFFYNESGHFTLFSSRSPSKEKEQKQPKEENKNEQDDNLQPLTVRVDHDEDPGKADPEQPSASTSGIGPSPKDSSMVMSGCEDAGSQPVGGELEPAANASPRVKVMPQIECFRCVNRKLTA